MMTQQKKFLKSFIIFSIQLIFLTSFVFAQDMILESALAGPLGMAYGKVFNSDSSVPADNDIAFISYFVERPGEVKTETSIGCSYSGGYWSVAVGNFPTVWSIGDVLRTEVTNIVNGETGTVDVVMTDAGSDAADDLYLEPTVPVELCSFAVIIQEGNAVLEWSTESETNNFGFEIQRKGIGQNFKKVGFVPGHGTTTSLHHYKFTDTELPAGTYFYRLKQMDHDGSFEFSDAKSVVLSIPSGYVLEQNFPNPFNAETVLRYQINQNWEDAVEVKLLVYNSLGELVRTLVNECQSTGKYSVTWDGRDNNGISVSSGIYISRLITKNHLSNLKMIYMK